MLPKDLLTQLKIPPQSLHIQSIRADLHQKITLITTFGFPVTNPTLLRKLRINMSKDFMRNHPVSTLSDIYAAKYIQQETLALEKQLDGGTSVAGTV